jgi:hypothetical protein
MDWSAWLQSLLSAPQAQWQRLQGEWRSGGISRKVQAAAAGAAATLDEKLQVGEKLNGVRAGLRNNLLKLDAKVGVSQKLPKLITKVPPFCPPVHGFVCCGIGRLGFGTARRLEKRMAVERGTTPTLQCRTCSSRYGLQSWPSGRRETAIPDSCDSPPLQTPQLASTPLLQVNELRATQVGSVVSSIAFFWLLFSGLFWSLLSWGLPIALLGNWIFPGTPLTRLDCSNPAASAPQPSSED